MAYQVCEGFQNTKYVRLNRTQRCGKTRYVVVLHYKHRLDTKSKVFYTPEEAKEYIATVPLDDKDRPIKPPADNPLAKYLPSEKYF